AGAIINTTARCLRTRRALSDVAHPGDAWRAGLARRTAPARSVAGAWPMGHGGTAVLRLALSHGPCRHAQSGPDHAAGRRADDCRLVSACRVCLAPQKVLVGIRDGVGGGDMRHGLLITRREKLHLTDHQTATQLDDAC